MYDRSVLNRRPLTNADPAEVSAKHREWPHRRACSDDDGPDDYSVGVDEGIRMDVRYLVAKRIHPTH
jgi:hypothetical protein